MKYSAGERVDFLPLTSQHPDTAVFQLTDEEGHPVMQPLTVSNGGLQARRKGALHPVFHAPHIPGKYAYKFWDSEQVTSGVIKVEHIRVSVDGPRQRPTPTQGQETQGVRAGHPIRKEASHGR